MGPNGIVYILTNKNNTTLYTGVTRDLQRRVAEHKLHLNKGFSDKYNTEKLVYYEVYDRLDVGIHRESLRHKIMTYQEIIDAIDSHLTLSKKEYWSDYYVGITDNINERLHGFHKVPEKGHWFKWCKADSETIARDVEKYYLKKGMDGDTGGGDEDTVYVYCYEIGPNTKER